MSETIELGFADFLAQLAEQLPGPEDLNAWCLPLFQQVARLHERYQVAPLHDLSALRFSHGQLWFTEGAALFPTAGSTPLSTIDPPTRGIEVSGHYQTGDEGIKNLQVLAISEPVTRPCYRSEYASWEQAIGHHDPLSDVYVLGLLLASCALGKDLGDLENLQHFAAIRSNLLAENPHLHPVFSKAIVQMTELSRHARAPDLSAIIKQLQDYREQNIERLGLNQILNSQEQTAFSRRQRVQSHLRDRLFDLSRRNRLLHFKPSNATVNLTVASFPYLLNVENIKAESLFYWHPQLADKLSGEASISLAKFIRFEDTPYVVPQLEALRSASRKDKAEYGFSSLRLVVAWLDWTNLKEDPQERITSPLVLLPIELDRVKAVRDAWTIKASGDGAEVNPALRHALKKCYGIELPESIELTPSTMHDLHRKLAEVIHASEPGVQLKMLDKPRVHMIKRLADLRLVQHRRKVARSGGVRGRSSYKNLQYSYSASSYSPLGLQLFDQYARLVPAPLADMVESTPRQRGLEASEATVSPELDLTQSKIIKDQFQVESDSPESPFEWRIDLTQLTLANFNYRKMSLLRDYQELIQNDHSNPGFDLLFSDQPRPQFIKPQPVEITAQTTVITADPTQAEAVAVARSNQSFIIQGPPGTGKSQTIVNLIADYLALGKRVLFVAEKRAAVDVVFHRLGQCGLDRLCALIHDSQADKKAFVMDLKSVYESWLADATPPDTAQAEQSAIKSQLAQRMQALADFDSSMQQPSALAGMPLLLLYQRSLLLAAHAPERSAQEMEAVPYYAEFAQQAEKLRMLEARIADLGAPPLAELTLRHLHADLLAHRQPITAVQGALDAAATAVRAINDGLRRLPMLVAAELSLAQLQQLAEFLQVFEAFACKGWTGLGDRQSALSQELHNLGQAITQCHTELAAKSAKTEAWKQKPAADDTERLRTRLGALETNIWRWFIPEFYTLKGIVNAGYDFSRHTVRPSYAEVLTLLSDEHQARAQLQAADSALSARFAGAEGSGLLAQVEVLRQRVLTAPAWLQPVLRGLSAQSQPESWQEVIQALLQITGAADRLLADASDVGLGEFAALLPQLEAQLAWVSGLAAPMAAINTLPNTAGGFAQAVRLLALGSSELETLSIRRTLAQIALENPSWRRFNSQSLSQILDDLDHIAPQLREANAKAVLEVNRQRFLAHVQLAGGSQAGRSAEQKESARAYQAGRRALENEFGKVMRYKAIRELASGETGAVVAQLKPVWMMSPLAISDTLPLMERHFDVVIFDEASQIPVEDAGPSLYRAAQTIIVGDEMQLPPTQFFASSNDEQDDEAVEDLASDSLLSQAAKQYPSTLLGWHYRSRSETLISFSNQLFYQGRLLTVPDAQCLQPEQAIVAAQEADAISNLPLALNRPVSLHRIQNGVYENRKNAPEAAYIAQLIRSLLLADSPLTLAVVAFSEAQQGEIESALSALAGTDAEFAGKLEAAYEREESGQFCGLIVKNLENVQGDERDLVIMSVCYGYDRNLRMLMNFGPINQAGGEKRLNVVFSRAKRHLFLVTSIGHADIKNDYNPGAAALKAYLHYAEALTVGDKPRALAALKTAAPPAVLNATTVVATEPLAEAIRSALQSQGYVVELGIGSSSFRVDLAVRRAEESNHRLGILLDGAGHYAQSNLAERYWQKPSLLQSFGWQVVTVLHKDWVADAPAVLKKLRTYLDASLE